MAPDLRKLGRRSRCQAVRVVLSGNDILVRRHSGVHAVRDEVDCTPTVSTLQGPVDVQVSGCRPRSALYATDWRGRTRTYRVPVNVRPALPSPGHFGQRLRYGDLRHDCCHAVHRRPARSTDQGIPYQETLARSGPTVTILH